MTFAIISAPRNFNHRCSALLASLNTVHRMLARDPQPRLLAVRNRTLANVDSIGLLVRMPVLGRKVIEA